MKKKKQLVQLAKQAIAQLLFPEATTILQYSAEVFYTLLRYYTAHFVM